MIGGPCPEQAMSRQGFAGSFATHVVYTGWKPVMQAQYAVP